MARRAAAVLVLASALAGCSDEALVSAPDPNVEPEAACVPTGTLCHVELRYPLSGARTVELRGDFAPEAWTQGVPMQIEGSAWRAEIAVPDASRIAYKFFVDGSEWVTDPLNPNKEPDGVGGENSVTVASCDLAFCPSEPPPPPPPGAFDWRSAVLYFVFVDRFHDGNPANDGPIGGIEAPANYQGGDFEGVRARIEEGYFDELGVNALWLTVPMDNPDTPGLGSDGHMYTGYHGYWPVDLDRVEEHFGGEAALTALVDAAHARGIKVLLDYAMNHVHQDAAIVAQNPSWFWPLDYMGQSCVCGLGCDWNDDYENKRCWFTDYLPDWNFTNAAARAYSVDNAIGWIERTGVDGFRLDAVKHIETEWLLELRQRVTSEIEPASGQHFYMVGETFESANRDLLAFYVGADRLDGQFDFPLRAVAVETLLRRSGTLYDLDAFLATNDGYYDGVMSTFLGNHDIGRIIHTAEDQPWDAWAKGDPWGAPPSLPADSRPFERVGVGFTFLFTTKGIPLVYYGDEIGLPGAGDPDNRRFMQWQDHTDHQLALRDHLGKLGAIRRDHPALWRGARRTVSVSSDTYAYEMKDDVEAVFVALNRADNAGEVTGMPPKGRNLLTDAVLEGPTLSLPPRSAVIVVPQ